MMIIVIGEPPVALPRRGDHVDLLHIEAEHPARVMTRVRQHAAELSALVAGPGVEHPVRLVEHVRAAGVETPVLVVTSRHLLEDVRGGLDRSPVVGDDVETCASDDAACIGRFVERATVQSAGTRAQLAATSAYDLEQAEARLRRRDARLRSLVETTQDAVIFIDAEARVVRFNPAAARMFGYDGEEVLGRPVTMLMPEPYAGEHDQYIERYERTGEPRAIGRIRTVSGQRKSGEEFPIELSVTELRVDQEVRYAAFIRDISETVKLQQQAIENAQLAVVGSTASMFAHEVGNPLNNMYLYAQLLSRRLRKLDVGDDVRGDLESIMAEMERLNRLLGEYRSFYRKEQLVLEPTHLGPVVEEVLRMQGPRPDDGAGPVRVERELPDDLPVVLANRDRVKQVLVNLCKNATEAMPDGGTLTVRVRASADAARIEVSDTGAGIEEGVDVFLPFRTTKTKGTGLGLPVVRQIVEAHGGSVSYRSEVGKGTTFVVVLPLAGHAPPAEPPA